MDDATWCLHCAAALQASRPCLGDELARLMAERLRDFFPNSSPWIAVEHFLLQDSDE